MAHEVETMAYYGEVPWHGLGIKVMEAMTASEAIKAGGLDWEVELIPLYMNIGSVESPNYAEFNSKMGVVRTSDNQQLGVVTPRYVPVQNKECFGFFDGVVGTGEAKYHTCGSLKHGSIVWMLAQLKDSLSIVGEQVDKYILLTNSHSGEFALQMFFTPIRVVCANTLRMAMGKDCTRFYSRHTLKIADRMNEAKEILGFTQKFYDNFKVQAEHLASIMLPEAQHIPLLQASYDVKLPAEAKSYNMGEQYMTATPQFKTKLEQFETVLATGKGMDNPAIKGTAWQAFNAIAEITDYRRDYKGENSGNARLNGVWFGSGNQIKQRAFDYLMKVN